MKIAIFGGSFDPPHLGHVEIANKALKELNLDKLIIMPNYLNPLKNSFSAPPRLRLKWLKKIFDDPKIEISDFEISKKRPVYTIETLNEFNPDFFIIGSDNLKTLHKWHKIDEILQKTSLVVATRGEVDKKLLSKYNIKKVLDVNIPVSSTEIRNENFKYLPEKIEKEIKEFYGQNR